MQNNNFFCVEKPCKKIELRKNLGQYIPLVIIFRKLFFCVLIVSCERVNTKGTEDMIRSEKQQYLKSRPKIAVLLYYDEIDYMNT